MKAADTSSTDKRRNQDENVPTTAQYNKNSTIQHEHNNTTQLAELSKDTSWYEVQLWKEVFSEAQKSTPKHPSCDISKIPTCARLCNVLTLVYEPSPPLPSIETIYSHELLSAPPSSHRVLLAFRLAGGLHCIAILFRLHMKGGVGHTNYNALVTLILAINELAEDPHNIHCLGLLGVHALLVQLVGDPNIVAISEEIYDQQIEHWESAAIPSLDELAASTFAKCAEFVAPYDSFPNSIQSLDLNIDLREPDIVHFKSMSSNSEQVKIVSGKCAQLLNDGIDMVANGVSLVPPECSIIIQSVKKRMSGHDDTGYIIWGASRLLSNLIYWGGSFFRKKSVLEIGAGLGLPGLLSAYFADKVWLTDFNLSVLHAAAYNIGLNKMDVSQKLANDAISAICHHAVSKEGNKDVLRLIAAQMDWDKLDDQCEYYSANSDDVNNTIRMDTSLLPKRHSIDVVIGADAVYCEEAAIGVVKSIKHFMAKDGLGIISATSSFTRFGIEFLPATAARMGLSCQKIPVSELGMTYWAYFFLGG